MFVFVKEFAWSLGILGLFSGVGYGVLVPWAKQYRYALFATPLAGILVSALSISLLYNFLRCSLWTAGMLSLGCWSVLSIVVCFYTSKESWRWQDWRLLLMALPLLALIVYAMNYASIVSGSPSILYMDGTDHLTYAQIADWVNAHYHDEVPLANQHRPYELWPSVVYSIDPRFGSYYWLALMADLRQLPAMYVYDFSCGVILSAAMLGLCALFSSSRLSFVILLLGLMTSQWFDYAEAGYFGKVLGYPSAIFVIGLFMMAKRPFTITQLSVLLLLTGAMAIMHSYLSGLYVITLLGSTFLFCRLMMNGFNRSQGELLKNDLLVLAWMIGLCIAISGILARPLPNTGFPLHPEFEWSFLLPRLFDLAHMGSWVPSLSLHRLTFALIAQLGIIASFVVLAYSRKRPVVLAMLLGSLLALGVIILLNVPSHAYQLMGTFYPWFLCAGVLLYGELSKQTSKVSMILILLAVSVVLHYPKSAESLKRYAGKNIEHRLQFSKNELDLLFNQIKDQAVLVDIGNGEAAYYSYPLINALTSYPKTQLYWASRSWHMVPAMVRTTWHPLASPKGTAYKLVLRGEEDQACRIQYQTKQYSLLDCHSEVM